MSALVNPQVLAPSANSQHPGPPGQADTLSDHAKMAIDADKKQAEAVGIVLALFAGALVSLAQIMENVTDNNTSASWQALRVFLYGAIMLNLTGAFLSLVTIKMCSDLPLANYQKPFKITHPPTASATAVSPIRTDVEAWSRLGILLDAGMSPDYIFVDDASKWVLLASGVCTFASLTFWVFLNSQNWNTAVITTTVLFIPAALVVIRAFLIASRGEGWR